MKSAFLGAVATEGTGFDVAASAPEDWDRQLSNDAATHIMQRNPASLAYVASLPPSPLSTRNCSRSSSRRQHAGSSAPLLRPRLGGASLIGAKGFIFGAIVPTIVLGAMRNGQTLLNVQAFYQLLTTGIIIFFRAF